MEHHNQKLCICHRASTWSSPNCPLQIVRSKLSAPNNLLSQIICSYKPSTPKHLLQTICSKPSTPNSKPSAPNHQLNQPYAHLIFSQPSAPNHLLIQNICSSIFVSSVVIKEITLTQVCLFFYVQPKSSCQSQFQSSFVFQ